MSIILLILKLVCPSCIPSFKDKDILWRLLQLYAIETQALACSHRLRSCPDQIVSLDFQGQSKGFGFAQFKNTEDAKSYVDPNFPFVNVPPPASHGASAAATFRRAIEEGAQHNGRRVKIDYSQSANPPGSGRRGPQFANDGTRDIGNAQTAVLLFRGLDPISSVAAIDQAMRSSSGSGKEGAKGMKRIILVKDKVTFASWGFSFVEFVDTQVCGNMSSFFPVLKQMFYQLVCGCCISSDNVSPDPSEWIPYLGQAGCGFVCPSLFFSDGN